MQDYIVETKVSDDKSLTIRGLPFGVGDRVEVIIRSYKNENDNRESYTLRGKTIRYADPFCSVAEKDWEALNMQKKKARRRG
jgi:hypothetical protein